MPPLRILACILSVTLCSGCGHLRLGRVAAIGAIRGEPGGADPVSDLRLEQKLLREELALVRKESDRLRAALERALAGSPGGEPIRRAAEGVGGPAAIPAASTPNEVVGSRIRWPAELDPRWVASLQEQARLQGENTRLQKELERARAENAGLGERLKVATEQHQRAQGEMAQLASELRAHQEGRAQAEQRLGAVQAQLAVVLASGARSGTAAMPPPGASALRLAKAPPADAIATVELRTDPGRLREATAGGTSPRVHVVQPGETWAQVAERYFGSREHARRLHDANPQLAPDRPLAAGIELVVPVAR